jgi:SAM-dependent methyltransferase
MKRLQKSGFTNLTGLDADLSGFGVEGVRVIQGDIDLEDVGLGDEKFSLITAIEVIEHLSNPGRLLSHASKHLASGGILVVTTPNMHSITARLRFLLSGRLGQFDEKGDPTHVAPVLLSGFERLLERYDLVLLKRWGYPQSGSVVFRRELAMAGRFLRAILPEEVPGDVLCMQIGRKGE